MSLFGNARNLICMARRHRQVSGNRSARCDLRGRRRIGGYLSWLVLRLSIASRPIPAAFRSSWRLTRVRFPHLLLVPRLKHLRTGQTVDPLRMGWQRHPLSGWRSRPALQLRARPLEPPTSQGSVFHPSRRSAVWYGTRPTVEPTSWQQTD